ncbi:MAG: DUF5715 family protein [Muribaculum sp.]|nr:DUF5715 family protein [Muribaculum sp.]
MLAFMAAIHCGCGSDKSKISMDVDSAQLAAFAEDTPGEEQPAQSAMPAIETPVNLRLNDLGAPLAKVFNDSNYRQYAYAEALGIDPIYDIGDAYFTKRPIVKVSSTENYYVDTLTHSAPYLVPEGEKLLAHIGKAFRDSLKSRGASGYRVKVTSLLRTRHSVKRLRRVNRNATDSSTHQFGTTFDLSWSNFKADNPTRVINDGDLKNLLAEVLYDARREGRCLVKYEHKTCCFHITATGR